MYGTTLRKDLDAVLPPAMVKDATRVCDAARLDDAFEVRRNVVNLKKVLLHSWHRAEPLEKELRRLSTFYRCARAHQPSQIHPSPDCFPYDRVRVVNADP